MNNEQLFKDNILLLQACASNNLSVAAAAQKTIGDAIEESFKRLLNTASSTFVGIKHVVESEISIQRKYAVDGRWDIFYRAIEVLEHNITTKLSSYASNKPMPYSEARPPIKYVVLWPMPQTLKTTGSVSFRIEVGIG